MRSLDPKLLDSRLSFSPHFSPHFLSPSDFVLFSHRSIAKRNLLRTRCEHLLVCGCLRELCVKRKTEGEAERSERKQKYRKHQKRERSLGDHISRRIQESNTLSSHSSSSSVSGFSLQAQYLFFVLFPRIARYNLLQFNCLFSSTRSKAISEDSESTKRTNS